MLLVFFGTDRVLIRDEATKYIHKNIIAGKTAHLIDKGDFEIGKIKDALGAASLFGEVEWYLLDEPSSQSEFNEEVLDSLSGMSESKNYFVILENKLLAATKKQYAKYASDVYEFSGKSISGFNPFGLAEALSQRDKKRLWVLLQEAKVNGMREEEIVGIFWWQLKTIRLAKLCQNASEAGLKEFSYKKATQALVKFSPREVDRLSQSLLDLYHKGHAGVSDMETSLEKWVLSI